MTCILVAFGLVACGGSNAQGGYMAQGADWVAFLQLTRNGNNLSGNLEDASISSSDPTKVSTVNASFTGATDGNSITLTFQEGFGFATSMSGTYSGSDINLSIPQPDGTLVTATFSPSDTDTYDRAVLALQKKAQQASADQQAQQAAQQQAQLEADERVAVDKAIAKVNSDFTTITDYVNAFKSLYTGINTDEQQAYKDTVTAYNDLQKVQAEGRSSPYCFGDAGVVSGDAGVVRGDLGVMEGDQGTEQASVQTLNIAVGQLDNDFQAFQTAEAAIPSYQPGGAPTSAQISQDHSAASQTKTQADSFVAAALNQVQTWLNQANGYATAAVAVCG